MVESGKAKIIDTRNGKIVKKIIGPMNNNLFKEIERAVK